MMHLQLKQIFLTSWTEKLTDGAGMIVHLLVLKFSMTSVIVSSDVVKLEVDVKEDTYLVKASPDGLRNLSSSSESLPQNSTTSHHLMYSQQGRQPTFCTRRNHRSWALGDIGHVHC